ncbi:LOW QUALITY PROTEIN: putative cytochrome P450 6a17 [Aphomia sociella]
MFYQILLVLLIVTLFYLYRKGKNNAAYWKRRGVKTQDLYKYSGFFGHFFFGKRPMFEQISTLYKKYRNEPAISLDSLFKHNLLIIDPTNVQHILQLNFQSFSHRGFDVNESDKLADNIVFMNGNRWKLMRQNMTSLFTSSKLKNMFYILNKSGEDFMVYLKKYPEKINEDAFELMTQYCSAAIGASVFGINTESVFDSPFLDIAKKAFTLSFWTNIKFSIMNIAPSLAKLLRIKLFSEFEDFFIGAIKSIIRQREKENVQKHDFADKAINLQKQGTMRDNETGLELEPTDELLAAQAFFFYAGVEPSATAMFGTLFELGKSPIHLQQVHDEIDSVFEKYNGLLTHDGVTEMKFLDKVISECMRLHPPIGFLTRKCVSDTVLPVGNIAVEKDTGILLPIYDIHHDPEHYPNPTVFDPSRFDDETLHNSSKYMAFGKGNRLCIGIRFARLQVKTGLIHLLRNYTVKSKLLGDKIEYRKEQVQVRPINLDIKLIPRVV